MKINKTDWTLLILIIVMVAIASAVLMIDGCQGPSPLESEPLKESSIDLTRNPGDTLPRIKSGGDR